MLQWGGKTDVGFHRETNEDAIKAEYIDDKQTLLFVAVADGMGSHNSDMQPAELILNEIILSLRNACRENYDVFIANQKLFLRQAMFVANRVIGALKLGKEDHYAGFAASVTCAIINATDCKYTFAHTGNTRLYILRTVNGETVIKQLTTDMTKGQQLINEGKLDQELYYRHQDRLTLLGGIGIFADPEINVFSSTLKQNDILLFTTDGIHYALRPEAIKTLVLASDGYEAAADNLITGAAEFQYIDNASALLVANIIA